ncbi:MAG: hypothetical protein U1E87_02370 [Alphaproteobacteria bacterium]
MRLLRNMVLLALALPASPAVADAGALPPLLTGEREIALAMSAGPPSIAKNATIYVLKRGGYQLARAGTNGFACLVVREKADTLEPQCYDPEGVASLLPVDLETARLRELGSTPSEIEAAIGRGYAEGRFRPPRRGGVTYMLSTENLVFNGERAVPYPPHIMIMAPYVTNADIGADESDPAMPWVLNPGKPNAYIMVVVRDTASPHHMKP